MRALALLFLLFFTTAAQAQTSDKDYLTRLLQDNLSGAGRVVNIEGFRGALSSRASLTEMTIADDQGIWLTLRGVTLDWNRAALLQGRVEISALTADEILLPRAPVSEAAPPSPEARSFALPVLPVSVAIGSVSARSVQIGAALFGEAAEVSMQGALQLSNGEGAANLTIQRLDGAEGRLALAASYANASRQLALDLALTEAPGGITSALLSLPGNPSVALTIRGTGLIDDYTANVSLKTDGQDRLSGTIRTGLELQGAERVNRLRTTLAGDIAPLFAADYRTFFGPSITLAADAIRSASGRLAITAFDLTAAQLALSGSLTLAPDGLPEAADIKGRIAAADGTPVLLPLPGNRAQVTAADLNLTFDAATSDQWGGTITLAGLQTTQVGAQIVTLQGQGRIARPDGKRAVNADLTFKAQGLLPADPALAEALGPEISGRGGLSWAEGGGLDLTSVVVNGPDYALTLAGKIDVTDQGPTLTGQTAASLDSLARLSALAARPLSGALLAEASGSYNPLSGAFDLTSRLKGNGLGLNQPELDRLLQGASTITLAASRTELGTTLHDLTLEVANLKASATGTLQSAALDLTGRLDFTSLATLGPAYSGSLNAEASLTGTLERPVLQLDGTGTDIATGLAPLDRLSRGTARLQARVTRAAEGWALDNLALQAGGFDAKVSGTLPDKGAASLRGAATLADLAALQPGLGGSLTALGTLQLDPDRQTLDVTGTARAIRTGVALPDTLLQGTTTYALAATLAGKAMTLTSATLSGPAFTATGTGTLNDGLADLTLGLTLPDLATLGPYGGTLTANGRVTGTAAAQTIALTANMAEVTTGQPMLDRLLNAPASLTADIANDATGLTIRAATLTGPSLDASVEGLLAPGASRLNALLSLPALAALGPYRGSLTATGSYAETGTRRAVTLNATGTGLAIGQAVPDRLLQGTTTLALSGSEQAGSIRIDRLQLDNPALTAQASGPPERLSLTARLADIALIAPGFSGPLTLTGSLQDTGGPYRLDLAASGPGALTARIAGTTARNFASANLTANGQAQAALVNGLIAPRSVEGLLTFALGLNGPIRLASLTGTLRTSGARLATGLAGLSITGIEATAALAAGQARITASGAGTSGGTVTVQGSAALAPPHSGDLAITLAALALRDPNLYETTVTGALSLRGPVTGGATISGVLDLGQTELRIPTTGLGAAAIPAITHLNEPAEVRETRQRAGLMRSGAGTGLAPARGIPFPLDITLNAPRRVFIRGRGLDAELGGTLRLGGTTAAIIPQGDLALIRGRLDLLGKRFTLDEGLARLQGRFLPFIRLVASTASGGITSSIIIEGEAAAPAITFSSVPQLPEEEVLARLLFGRAISAISPLQAAQLAGAVASLAGRGGEGLIAKLRRGFGLDDLDLQTDDTGNAALRAGKYLSEKVYTDVTIGADGKSAISLNLDLSPSITLRGKAGSDGNTGLGLFFEKDY